MGFISLVDKIQFMLISSRYICIRSIVALKSGELHIDCFHVTSSKSNFYTIHLRKLVISSFLLISYFSETKPLFT